MTKPAAGSLHQIDVVIEKRVDDNGWGVKHRTLTVAPTLDWTKDHGGFNAEEVLHAYRWAAGVICRAALALDFDLACVGYQHGCTGWSFSGGSHTPCGVVAFGISDDLVLGLHCDPPTVWFEVPHDQAKDWQARIQNMLTAIMATDQRPATFTQQQPAAAHSRDALPNVPAVTTSDRKHT